MNRPWLLLIPIMAGVAPLAAQLTADQRQQREAAAQSTTIGRTREIEAEQRLDNDPLRGLRCYGTVSVDGRCGSLRARRYAPINGAGAESPAGIHWVAFGEKPSPATRMHPLGTMPVTLRADRPTTLTLASPIGAPARPLMIRTVVGAPNAEPVWSRIHDEYGDPDGRYLVPVPAFSAGTYQLLVEVYDVDRPLVPYSISRTTLNVK